MKEFKVIREAVATALEALVPTLITEVELGRANTVPAEKLPMLRVQRGNEVIDASEPEEFDRITELHLVYLDKANKGTDDRIDVVVDEMITTLMQDSVLASLTNNVTAMSVNIEHGEDNGQVAFATLIVQINYSSEV